ncbi:MAG: hypothetical protein U0V74_09195 [Chitinophagales bacterium]
MIYTLDFLPSVAIDVKDAYNWYEDQLPGLGEDFLLSTDAALNAIKRGPMQFAKVYKTVRHLKVKRFPFGVFYVVNHNVITVTAIVHLSRHPTTWKSRRVKRK